MPTRTTDWTQLFGYDLWANRQSLASLTRASPAPARSIRLLAHIIAAERLWLARLTADPEPVVVWPELSLSACELQLPEVSSRWRAYLDGLRVETLNQPVSYKNSKGEPWTNRVEDILMHVIMHSAYHRGQIAADVRQSGSEPASTDFIHAVRQGFA